CSASVLAALERSDELFALADCFPFVAAVILGTGAAVVIAGSDGVLADACSPSFLCLLDPRSDPTEGPS
nr:hypothetical protein [Tanacetum cinerariifolium]